ncbi:hypothetical protein F5884DRAFT_861318 [Xylogone sp. PMI_703]|nr:hypothetical protein F5884DRAFT_861318 [Xylogone sp. PMI_703]
MGVEVMQWDQGIYETIPIDRQAFRRVEERQIPDKVFAEIRSVFQTYGVQDYLGLGVIHRHFSLEPSEQLVEYHRVTTPWRVSDLPNYLQVRISPKNWMFINGNLYPYEFRLEDSEAPAEPYSFPPGFAEELLEVLSRHGIQDMYGLVKFVKDPDTAPSTMCEFTAGRTSFVVPFTPEMENSKIEHSTMLFVVCESPRGYCGIVKPETPTTPPGS